MVKSLQQPGFPLPTGFPSHLYHGLLPLFAPTPGAMAPPIMHMSPQALPTDHGRSSSSMQHSPGGSTEQHGHDGPSHGQSE